MPDVSLSFSVKFQGAFFERANRVLRAPMGEGRGAAMIASLRKSVAREFRQLGWSRPEGGIAPWKETLPFGDQPEKAPLGGSSGMLARAWAGGRFGFSVVARDRASIGVAHPGAAMHRGGSGTETGRKVTIVRPRKFKNGIPAMFWALGLGKGAWISPKRLARGLEIPARPHATANPQLVKELEEQFLARLLGRAA